MKYGNMEIMKYRNIEISKYMEILEIWKYGNMEIWKYNLWDNLHITQKNIKTIRYSQVVHKFVLVNFSIEEYLPLCEFTKMIFLHLKIACFFLQFLN